MKNRIFANKINKKIGNNQAFYDISDITKEQVKTSGIQNNDDNLTVNEKIDKLLKRNGYIFNVDVKIITTKREFDTKIAGKMNNHLITIDNDIINISDIKDIIIKN